MLEQVQILQRCTTSKFTEYLALSVAFDRWYDIKIIYSFCKKIGWWDFCFAQKFCKFCKFWRKYFNRNISGHVCIQPKLMYATLKYSLRSIEWSLSYCVHARPPPPRRLHPPSVAPPWRRFEPMLNELMLNSVWPWALALTRISPRNSIVYR